MKYYRDLRIYKEKSALELANLFMINKLLHYSFFVNNAHLLYSYSSKILGLTLTEFVIKNTMGRIFTGGSTITELLALSNSLKKRNLPVIVDYCCEALEEDANEQFMDKSAKMFEATSILGDNIPNHKISLKISALCDMEVLKALTVISGKL